MVKRSSQLMFFFAEEDPMFSYQSTSESYDSCGMFQPIERAQRAQDPGSHRRNMSPHWREVDRWQQYYPVVLPESLHISNLRPRSPKAVNVAQKRTIERTYKQNKKLRQTVEETYDSMELCSPSETADPPQKIQKIQDIQNIQNLQLDNYYHMKW